MPIDSMLPQSPRATKVAFGPFEFDPASGELRKNGYKVKLPRQPGEILAALIAGSGEIVTREDLRIRLWPGINSGDFEHGVNAAVNKLRQVLGDAATAPRYIETLPGRGYRFVAPISPVSERILELVPALEAAELQRSPKRVLWVGAGAAVGAALVLLLVFWVAGQRSPVLFKPTRFLIYPPKGYYLEGGGVRQSFALSPDGGRIAFTAKDASGAFRLFLRDFSELESRPVADGEGAYSVVWTPDGQMLLFTGKGKLRRMAVNAAASQILSDDVPYFSSAIPFGPDRLLVSNPLNSGVIPLSGGTPHPIGRAYSWAQLLPGGRDFLYTIDDPQLGSMRARIAATGSSEQGVE